MSDTEDLPGDLLVGGAVVRQGGPTDATGGRGAHAREGSPSRGGELLAFAVVYVIWGSTYLGIRIGVRSIPPFLLAGGRALIAGIVLFVWLRTRGAAAPTVRQWARATLAGTLMLAAGNGLVTWAETRVASNVAALLIAAVPLYVALLDWLRPAGARPSRRALLGIAIGAMGMVLLASPDPRAIPGSGTATAAMLLAGLAWAGGSLYARYNPMHPSPLVASAQQMIAGGLVLLVVAAIKGEPAAFSFAAVTRESAIAFVYLTVFGSLVAFSAFNWLITASTPTRLSTTAYVNPVVAVILGWIALGETLRPRPLLGATLILCAVAVMVMRGRRPGDPNHRRS